MTDRRNRQNKRKKPELKNVWKRWFRAKIYTISPLLPWTSLPVRGSSCLSQSPPKNRIRPRCLTCSAYYSCMKISNNLDFIAERGCTQDAALLLVPLLFSLTALYSRPAPRPAPLSQVTFLTGAVNVSLFWLLLRPSTHSRLFQAAVKESADGGFFTSCCKMCAFIRQKAVLIHYNDHNEMIVKG